MSKHIDDNWKSWLDVDPDSDFPIQNIPFGVYTYKGKRPCIASRIGDWVIDLAAMENHGYFSELDLDDYGIFHRKYLNEFIAQGKEVSNKVRYRIAEIFEQFNAELKNNVEAKKQILLKLNEVEMLMPVKVGDYTDFYSSIEHATNVGIMFRDPDNALLPNWKHIPVGYHGRSSSIVISGTNIQRPNGQTKADADSTPSYGPSKLMDFELEMAFITGVKTELGDQIPVDKAEDHIFGLVVFNDLSARDIQKWEYVPLGPFLGKNFGSVISPWIVTLEALAPFRVECPKHDVEVLPYLDQKGKHNLNVNLEVGLQPENGDETIICRSNMKYLYWSMAQQLAHHTVNGCNINVGDMYASGTISGPTEDSYGSMLELSWKGTKPLKLNDGSKRKFMLDNDTVIMRAYAKKDNLRIGFGEVRTKILPPKK